MRKFEFQIYDDSQLLIDSYNLSIVTDPTGFGFSQKLDVVKTRTVDYIVDRSLEKKDIKLSVHFEEPNSFQKINRFRAWYANYITKKMVLKYNDGSEDRYIDVAIKEFNVTEINTKLNTVPLTLQPLSPFYSLKSKQIIASIQTVGKAYPYSYPYAYGGGVLENAIVDNKFFESIPIAVRVIGRVVNPQISLKDENNTIYATVNFSAITVDNNESLLIDAINSRILFYNANNPNGLDYYNNVDKSKQTFLFAKPGRSTIIANLDQNEANAKLQITYVQYGL